MQISVLCGDAEDGLFCRPVQVGALFAQTQGLPFQALQPLSFFFICTLLRCKHCTWLEVPTNVRKFALTVLCGDAEDGVFCRPVQVGAVFPPKRGLHFQALQSLSLLFICTLHWWKHCTGLEVTTECAQISIDGSKRRCRRRRILHARPGRCAFFTETRFTFPGSAAPQLLFHIHLALLEALYRAKSTSECA